MNMEQLSKLGLKYQWDTENDNVVEDFYIKTLNQALKYDRATLGFGSTILTDVAAGLEGLVDNNGSIRILIGEYLNEYDLKAVIEGNALQEKHQDLSLEKLKESLRQNNTRSSLNSHRFDLLRYFIGSKKLEIKYALLSKGVFHDKSGIIYGKDNEKITFKGSGNFSRYGTDYNWESFDIYCSWDKDIFIKYGKKFEDDFLKLWSDRSTKCKVIQLPNDRLDKIMKEVGKTNSFSVNRAPEKKELELIHNEKRNLAPCIPSHINGHEFEPRDYQKDALNSWKKSNFKGIFEHATGSGKTLTAIYGITTLFLSPKTRGNIISIVAVPYTILAKQWAEEFSHFNITPILCFDSSKKWLPKINNRLSELPLSDTNQLVVIIVVNATLIKPAFQKVIKKIKELKIQSIFVGDECHEYRNTKPALIPSSELMLGLSATPFNERSYDEADNNRIRESFGDICDSFSLKEALDLDYLCPYEYKPIFIRLTEEEESEYLKLTAKIAAMSSKDEVKDAAQAISAQRARLIGSAEEKFIKLKSLVKKMGNIKNTLVFTGDGKTEDITEEDIKDKHRTIDILKSVGWDVAEFTAEVTSNERTQRIKQFVEKDLNALVAIKVLDQGVNIPAIQTAIILASTRSKRQYIQRLGRILRKSEGKEISYIYDFIVLPYSKSSTKPALSKLIEEEKIRFDEFSKNAINKDLLEKENYNMFNNKTWTN